jgi:hypothetical protein
MLAEVSVNRSVEIWETVDWSSYSKTLKNAGRLQETMELGLLTLLQQIPCKR